MRQLGDEIPYSLPWKLKNLKRKNVLLISAVIWVERKGQRKL